MSIIDSLFNNKKVQPETREELEEYINDAIEEYGTDCDLNFIDTSLITDFGELFAYTEFNGDISRWDVSNATDMNSMFECSNFDGDISRWDVSNVTDMSGMFNESPFEGDISKWDVSNVTDMCCMFQNTEFNGDISNWNVSNVENMSLMFSASKFNGDISKWDVSNVTDMSGMFSYSEFNGDISKWNVSKVTNMEEMFCESEFKGDISKWDMSNVTNKSNMFSESETEDDSSDTADAVNDKNLSEIQKKRVEFFVELKKAALQSNEFELSGLKFQNFFGETFTDLALGSSKALIEVRQLRRKNSVGVAYIFKNDFYKEMYNKKDELEKALGVCLNWSDPNSEKKSISTVYEINNVNYDDEVSLQPIYVQLVDLMVRFKNSIRAYL